MFELTSKFFIFLAFFSISTHAMAMQETTQWSAEDIRSELHELVSRIRGTHPDLNARTDSEELDRFVSTLDSGLTGHYDLRRAWQTLARINPILNDAHAGLRVPEDAHLSALARGAASFSVPVRVVKGRIFVADTIATGSGINRGWEIHSINGDKATDIAIELRKRMRGESQILREHILSLKFPIALWALQGSAEKYELELSDQDGRNIVHTVNPAIDIADAGKTNPFKLSYSKDVAVLTVNTFDIELEEKFTKFLEGAFDSIKDRKSQGLIIDLRGNGGGAKNLSDRLMGYLTAKRYTPISAVTARITKDNQSQIPGSEVGSVVKVPFAQWVEPSSLQPTRFSEPIAIMVGAMTYSQAIVFAATAQDFDIGTIVGSTTEGPANQSGQVQRFALNQTGLVAQAPIYLFTRASGRQGNYALQPDVPIRVSANQAIAATIELLKNPRE